MILSNPSIRVTIEEVEIQSVKISLQLDKVILIWKSTKLKPQRIIIDLIM